MSMDKEFQIMQLSDSFFPSGIFSMSGGLESLFNQKVITNMQQVYDFILEQIEFQLLPCDCNVVKLTMSAVKENDIAIILDIDKKFYSMKLTKDIRNSLVRSGKQVFNCLMYMIESDNEKNSFLNQFRKKIENNETSCTYPVAFGIYAQIFKIPLTSAIKIMLYSFSSSVVSAAIRLGIIQHLEGQKILAELAKPVNNFVSEKLYEKTTDIWQLTPLTEIHQMYHEHNESRMFMT